MEHHDEHSRSVSRGGWNACSTRNCKVDEQACNKSEHSFLVDLESIKNDCAWLCCRESVQTILDNVFLT